MPRPVAGHRGEMGLPGLRAGLAARWRRFDRSFPGAGFGGRADAVEGGEQLTVDGDLIWASLFDTHPRVAAKFLRDSRNYLIPEGADAAVMIDG